MNRFAVLAAALAAGLVSLSFLAPVPAQSQGRRMYVPAERVQAPKTAPRPVYWKASAAAAARVSTLDFNELPLRRLLEVERHNARSVAKPTQIGVARITAVESAQPARIALDWVSTAAGGHTARFQVRSPDALALRVGLLLEAWDPRAELRVAGNADGSAIRLVAGAQALRQAVEREYWTPSTDGDTQVIEVHAPAGVPTASIRLQVPRISHLFTDSRREFQLLKGAGDSGTCNVDMVCRVDELGEAYLNAAHATARVLFIKDGAGYLCTGTQLADEDPRSQIPWFFTAHHCIPNQTVASTVETWWGYYYSNCGGSGTASPYPNSDGALYIHSDPTTDASLLRIQGTNRAVAMAGWDARPRAANSGVFAIHHPSGDLLKVSQGMHLSSTASQHVVAWTSGTTEGGSSGSGLFDPGSFLLRGGLFRGTASCANTGSTTNTANRDEYSRFDLFYPSVAQHLSPPLPPNDPPVAAFDFVVPLYGEVQMTDRSSDHDGRIVSWQWTFGDGTTSPEPSPSHLYAAGGMYAVTLKVIDDWGKVGTVTRMVRIPTTLRDSTPLTLSGPAGWVGFYRFSTPLYARNLRITLSGGTGNADLYLQRGTYPTTTSYLLASRGPTNAETLAYQDPGENLWVVMVHSPQAFSGATLTATYDGGDKPVTMTVTGRGIGREGSFASPEIIVKLSAPRTSSVRFRVSPAGGTAQAHVDYDLATEYFEIWPGKTEAYVTLPVRQDLLIEPAESIVVRVSEVTGATLSGDGVVRHSLMDDDGIRGVNDFDGDSRSDVFWRHAEGNNDIWLSAQATTRRATVRVGDLNWQNEGAGDIDGDFRADVLWRNKLTGAIELWMSGNYLTRRTLQPQAPSIRLLGIGKSHPKALPAPVWYNPATNAVRYWRDSNKALEAEFSSGPRWGEELLGFGKVFSPDQDSVVVRNTGTGRVCLLRYAYERCPTGATAGADWKIAGVGDFDGDGAGDVFWRNPKTGGNTIWLSSGADDPARRVRWVPAVTDLNWSVAAIGEYNDDGRSDVLWRNGKTGANDLWYSGNSATRVALAPVADVRWRVMP